MGPHYTYQSVQISYIAPHTRYHYLERNMHFQKYGELHMGPYLLQFFLSCRVYPSHVGKILFGKSKAYIFEECFGVIVETLHIYFFLSTLKHTPVKSRIDS